MALYTCIPLSIQTDSKPTLKYEQDYTDQSIDSILELIVFTPKGSCSADPDFGFEYWNHEFSNLNVREFNNSYLGMMSNVESINEITRRQCEASLKDSILAYEPRLLLPEVKVELNVNSAPGKRNMPSKYQMRISITGSIDDGLGVARKYEKRIAFMVEPVACKIIS